MVKILTCRWWQAFSCLITRGVLNVEAQQAYNFHYLHHDLFTSDKGMVGLENIHVSFPFVGLNHFGFRLHGKWPSTHSLQGQSLLGSGNLFLHFLLIVCFFHSISWHFDFYFADMDHRASQVYNTSYQSEDLQCYGRLNSYSGMESQLGALCGAEMEF